MPHHLKQVGITHWTPGLSSTQPPCYHCLWKKPRGSRSQICINLQLSQLEVRTLIQFLMSSSRGTCFDVEPTSMKRAQFRTSTVIPDQFWHSKGHVTWSMCGTSPQRNEMNIDELLIHCKHDQTWFMSSGCQLTQGKHLQFLKPRPKWRLIHVNLGAPIMKKNLANKICAEAVEQHALVTSQVCSAQLSSPALQL